MKVTEPMTVRGPGVLFRLGEKVDVENKSAPGLPAWSMPAWQLAEGESAEAVAGDVWVPKEESDAYAAAKRVSPA
jgi:hypothetical protein